MVFGKIRVLIVDNQNSVRPMFLEFFYPSRTLLCKQFTGLQKHRLQLLGRRGDRQTNKTGKNERSLRRVVNPALLTSLKGPG